ncbi:hypothetical protein CPB84DRAFT_1716808 [Gymnopilus junonius]|uniref:Potassium channel domain-containing protein n=1 Tax=Gymnopilus junonius TaxID=109634 RepID=A0A9P5N758_GYMJU|nr:hypothetical protein CPB84DRAFT_1716808 [Gymnopilus junonius]
MLILPKPIRRLFVHDKSSRTSEDPEKNSRPKLNIQLEATTNDMDFLDDAVDSDSTRSYRVLPIFSGIMIPFSVMLSIPSLTGHWYVRTGADNAVLQARPNPPLLNAGMALSMACGVLASTCLVIRFAERRIKTMTMFSIIFLTLHDLINIPAVTIFGVEHRFSDGFTYGQGFWFTVCSTIASTLTNITLITDYCQTKDFSHAGSGLTPKQRSLVIIIIVLLGYLSLGSLIIAVMLRMDFIDALYLSVVSIETIGFGDLHPTSAGSRIFTCFYVAGGILNLALAVALSRDALLEAAAVGFRARLGAFKARQRERRIRSRWRAAVRWRLRENGYPVWVDDLDREQRQRVDLKKRHHHWYSKLRSLWRRASDQTWREWEDPAWRYVYGKRHKRLNLEVLTESQLETAALEAGAPLSELVPKGLKLHGMWCSDDAGGQVDASNATPPNPWFATFDTTHTGNTVPPTLTHMRLGGMVTLLGKFAVAVTHGFQPESRNQSPQDAQATEEEGDDLNGDDTYNSPVRTGLGVPFTRTMTMTTMHEEEPPLVESLELEERSAFRVRLGLALTLFVIFWMVGAAIFMQTENWGFGSAVYFCFVSFTTVGYGDFAPKTPAGRSIFVVWALVGVGTMTILISILAEAYSTQYKSIIKSEILDVDIEIDTDHHNPVLNRTPILATGNTPTNSTLGLLSVTAR